MIWLDALDLPIVRALEASYAVEGAPQAVRNQPDGRSRATAAPASCPIARSKRAAPAIRCCAIPGRRCARR